MSFTRLFPCAVAVLGLLGSACQQTIPKSQFNARKVDQTVKNLTFSNVAIKRSLDPKLLRSPHEPYILGPGDVLEIEIAEVPGTLARTFVMPDGMVYYNLAEGVHAEGLTSAAFAKQLSGALKRDYTNPLVNVSLVEVRSRRYWMLGQVLHPGIYPLRQPTTLLEAVSQSGGLAMSGLSGTSVEIADLASSVIIRDGDILPVSFEKLIKSGDMSQNVFLHHNDLIYLPSANSSTVLLLGAVGSPQAIRYKESLTLVDCLAQGKGPNKDACINQVVIVRGSLEKPTAAIVNLKAIITGQETDVLLQPGDIVWIPYRPLGLIESTVKLIFNDAARSYAASAGAKFAGSSQNPTLSIPLSQPTP
ncbi:MAG: polysaccharide biosynthesis/export family protein [Verrucomicrobiota bacterium]